MTETGMTTPTIEYNLGGLIATASPKGHPNMILCWDLIASETFYGTGTGRKDRNDITNQAQFKKRAEELFEDCFRP